MDTDRELKAALFLKIFESHQRAIFSFFIGHGVVREDAVDLVQDTFTRAWQQIDKFENLGEEKLRFWLFSVARNLVVDRGRRRVVQKRAEDFVVRTAVASLHTPPSRTGEIQALMDAIQCLPENQRLILSLTVIGEMNSEMIGAQLGRPAGTIRYELHQAREKLKRTMQDWEEGL